MGGMMGGVMSHLTGGMGGMGRMGGCGGASACPRTAAAVSGAGASALGARPLRLAQSDNEE